MNSSVVTELTSFMGENAVSTSQSDLVLASRDESDLQATLPEVVVWAELTEDVLGIVAICRKYKTPLTVRGAGSSLEGNPIPVRGGVVLDLTRMNKVLAIRPDDLLATVQPGIVYDQLNEKLRPHALFFPPSPGGSADVATVGGMVANNASGIYALKYGGTKRHILGLTVVTGAGEVIRTGHKCPKTSAGYDLTALVCGSEGTLAIVTEVTLSLTGRPGAVHKAAYQFQNAEYCARAIATLVASGVDLAACEFIDSKCVYALNQYKNYDLPERPLLFLEIHGVSEAAMADTVSMAQELCLDHGGEVLDLGEDPWQVRHWATRAVRALHPGTSTIRCDVAFPISMLPQVVALAHQNAAAEQLNLYTFGHVGLGILHVLIQADPTNFERWEAADEVRNLIVETVVDQGGTCSGEHGVGLGNRQYMKREHGMAVDVMRRIKTAFDPDGILNPGKIFP
ncbi:MAG TPA: FAD-binding oxidoreductase [Myxococcales bacterium]|nr:FAD-binding oxidoreductase [Myxococcales bacterium]HIN86548.1 FAD-binding oxidoreductase [Myxococcales bacterium]